jgi:hypothetical protein
MYPNIYYTAADANGDGDSSETALNLGSNSSLVITPSKYNGV